MTDLDLLLRAAAPVHDDDLPALTDAALAGLAREVMATDAETAAPLASRRRRRRTVAALAVAGIVAIPTAAAATYESLHTGHYGAAGDTEDVPGEEFLNLGSPDVVTVLHQIEGETALPPGATFASVDAQYPVKDGGLGQRTVLVQAVQFSAQCSWYRDWLGNPARRGVDQPTIAAIAQWEIAKHFAPGDSGPAILQQIADQAAAGRSALMQQWVTANC